MSLSPDSKAVANSRVPPWRVIIAPMLIALMRFPSKKNQTQELNRTGLDRSASLRLPWGGNTREVMPPTFISRDPPKKLRRLEKRQRSTDFTLRIIMSASGMHHWLFRRAFST